MYLGLANWDCPGKLQGYLFGGAVWVWKVVVYENDQYETQSRENESRSTISG